MTHGALCLRDAKNILKLGLGPDGIFAAAATQPTQNIPSLLLPTDFNQPTWGFREEPNGGE
jgi:hypothetical protein